MKKDDTSCPSFVKIPPPILPTPPFLWKKLEPPSLFFLQNSKTQLPFIKVGGEWGNYVNINHAYTYSLTLAPSFSFMLEDKVIFMIFNIKEFRNR